MDVSDSPRPLIVVTVSDPARTANPALTERKNELYLEAIRRAGGNGVALHTATSPKLRARLIREMNGLLLSGGPDLDPALYGEEIDGAAGVDRARDALELEAWRAAGGRDVPVLGICRGVQAVNVFSGGRLLQDVPGHAGISYGLGPAATHEIDVDPASKLAGLLGLPTGGCRLTVNTFHHQAVNEQGLGPNLVASAWAESGHGRIVEGVEGRGSRWIIGVQCHPERVDSSPSEFESLWRRFVDAALGR